MEKGEDGQMYKYINFWRTNAEGHLSPKKLRVRRHYSNSPTLTAKSGTSVDSAMFKTDYKIVQRECEADL